MVEKELKEEIIDAMMTYATFIALNFMLDLYGRGDCAHCIYKDNADGCEKKCAEGMVMWATARMKPVVLRKQKEVQNGKIETQEENGKLYRV